jgi:hypothetical protein
MPIAQILIIDSIKNVNNKAQYFIRGKEYQAKDFAGRRCPGYTKFTCGYNKKLQIISY